MAYIGTKPTAGNFQICDAISVVNGQAAYTMQVGSVNVIPQSANHMIVSLNGVIQKPGSSFTVSGSTITFASNLATGDAIDFIQILGDVLDLGTPSDATVTAAKIGANAVTAAKLNNDIISGSTELASEPADTDEFLVSDAGTLKRIDYSLIKGGGKIGQVVSTFKSDAFSSTSDGFFDITGLSVSITPSATSSKILVISDLALGSSDFNAFNIGFKVLRGSTDIGISTAGSNNYSGGFNFYGNDTTYAFGNAKVFLDSPSSTSSLTYKVQGTKLDSSGTFYLNRRGSNDGVGGASSITVMEVLA